MKATVVLVMEIIGAWLLADLLSGLWHLTLDNGYGPRRMVADFQRHHKDPDGLSFNRRWLLIGAPLILLWPEPFWLALGVAMSVTQLSHQLSHARYRPWPVRVLQTCRVLLPPAHHAVHHRGNFKRRLCVLNGVNNYWLDWVL